MAENSWSDFHRRWSRLKPPLRANCEVTAAIAGAIEDRRDCPLLLGVTPELSDIGTLTVALDWSEAMIAHIWPGDTAARSAVLGNWLAMPFHRRRFSAAIGDGSLNAIDYSDYSALFAQLESVLLPGARVAVRIYATPEPCEPIARVRQEALAGNIAGFHALKWRLATAIAAEMGNANVPVALIHRIFDREFSDRGALSRATGWGLEDIDEIDAYDDAKIVYSFPTRGEIMMTLPRSFSNPRFLNSGSYELAERCPVFVADFAP